jgi:hypothetical protein
MLKKSSLIARICALIGACLFSLSANAALYDRGNGLIYDDMLDITWLQDANYAKTSGYDADGNMSWASANAWADQLTYGGYDDWRLPSAGANPQDGYNQISGELGYMYYMNLNGPRYGGGCGTCKSNTYFKDGETGLTVDFYNISNSNLNGSGYWYMEDKSRLFTYGFRMWSGYLDSGYSKSTELYAWAVADGDIAAVPIPAAAWLFGSALLGLVGIKRRR